MKYILIKADFNDADYLHSFHSISDETLEIIKPVIAVLQAFKADPKNQWNRHNWDTEGYHGHCTPKEQYVDTGKITEEQYMVFDELVPHNGDHPIYCVESIRILEVTDIKELL